MLEEFKNNIGKCKKLFVTYFCGIMLFFEAYIPIEYKSEALGQYVNIFKKLDPSWRELMATILLLFKLVLGLYNSG